MGIPDTEKTHNDVIDLLTDSYQVVVEEPDEAGTPQKMLQLDPEIVWWQTHLINSNAFGRFAYEYKVFEGKARDCYNNMTKARADIISKQILEICNAYKRSIDAKSSETRIDKNNNTSNLIQTVSRNKQERYYNIKGEGKKTFIDGFLGRDAQQERET